jgi:hypothetical protein
MDQLIAERFRQQFALVDQEAGRDPFPVTRNLETPGS